MRHVEGQQEEKKEKKKSHGMENKDENSEVRGGDSNAPYFCKVRVKEERVKERRERGALSDKG